MLSDHFLVPPLHCSILLGFIPAGYIFQVPLLAGFPIGSVNESQVLEIKIEEENGEAKVFISSPLFASCNICGSGCIASEPRAPKGEEDLPWSSFLWGSLIFGLWYTASSFVLVVASCCCSCLGCFIVFFNFSSLLTTV